MIPKPWRLHLPFVDKTPWVQWNIWHPCWSNNMVCYIYNEYDHTCMVTYIYIFCILTILYIFYACSCANQFIYQICVQHWNRFAVNPDPIFLESHQLSFEDHHCPPCPSHQLSSFPCSNSSKAKDRKARKWPEWHLTSNQHPNVLVGF